MITSGQILYLGYNPNQVKNDESDDESEQTIQKCSNEGGNYLIDPLLL